MKRFKKCTRSLLALMLLVVLMAAEVSPVWAAETDLALPAEAAATVDDVLFERTVSIKSTKSGNYISGTNGAMADGSSYEEISVYRYGDLGADLLDDVPVALYLNTTGAYLSMSISERRGGFAFLDTALTRDGAEQFVLEKAADWSMDNMSYHIYHPQSGYYLDVDDSQRLYAYGTTAPEGTFVFSKIGYTNVGLLTTLPGYAQLTDDQKQRVLDVYGGIGARSLFRYGGYDTEWTIENALRETASSIYANKDTTTAEEQASAMLTGMDMAVYDGQTNWYGLPEVLYTAGTRTELSEGIAGTYDFWSGTMLEGMQYTFSVIDDYGTHTMTVYIENNSVAQTNAANLMEAIKQTPYPIRRNIRTIKVRNDSANSYNCGQYDLYMRLTWSPSVNDIAQYITHEFGHSMDFSYNVSNSGSWDTAKAADILRVSGYGSNNSYEDFAEFGRLYFQQYGNYNGMCALRQLYPNRYEVYTQALLSAQYEDIYEKYLYDADAVQEELYDGILARFTFDDEENGLKSGTAAAKATGTVVLDENGKSGKALSLDGTGSNYLNVWKRDNTNLLDGYDEFTISYYSKPEKDSASWPVFLAANGNAQNYQYERYIGILDTASGIEVERYNNYGSRPASLTAEGLSNEDWRHVVLVVENDMTTLYVDGEKVSELASDMTVHDILGSHSVFQIGKGNWNSGEYYQGLIDEFTVYGRALTEAEIQEESQEKQPLAHFTFNNGTSGMMSGGAIAVGSGTYEFSTDTVEGGSLKLDGSGFVNITKADGTPLMTGADEMTISYYSKSVNDTTPWTVYLSANTNGQTYAWERYLGILDGSSDITIERYNNSGVRPNSISEAHAKGSEWKHVVVVVENGMTTLYIDGEKAAYQNSPHALSDITGDNSIFQVGKGNWGSGEYFQGYIDEMAIWDSALSEHEIEAYIQQDHSTQAGVVLADFDFDDEATGFTSDYGMAAGTYTLQAHDNGNAVYLDGTGNFLEVTKRDGSSLLTGVEEMTISMQAKPNAANTNWLFFASPDDSEQTYQQEKYLGILDQNGNILAERYNNTTGRPATATAATGTDDWYYVTVVQTATETILYMDGAEVARQSSEYAVADILGANSILYIGKANWGSGEYYSGLIDNLKIQSYALSAEEVKAQAEAVSQTVVQADKTALAAALNNAVPETEKDTYTEDSWNTYAAALAAANEVNANADATQDEVDAAVKDLTDAQAALEEKPAQVLVEDIYDDVAKEDWYRDSVQYVYDNGIMSGMNETTFGTQDLLSRGQLALMLYRMEGSPEVTYEAVFSDVPESEWFAKAVLWAQEKGIVTGYSGTGTFGPNDQITREQMAVMMYRYANYKGYDTTASADLGAYTDAAKVSGYAETAMKWAVGSGMITGKSNGTALAPLESTTRTECATIIQRFAEAYEN